MRRSTIVFLHLFAAGPTFGAGSPATAGSPTAAVAPNAIALPGGETGIGFDDLGYSSTLGKVLVPAGRTGRLDLVDPASGQVVSITGFTRRADFPGGHDDGITSVAEGAGMLFVTDRTALQLSVVDPAAKSIVAHVKLGASPDYVRWFEPKKELWVTEPDAERLELFRFVTGSPPRVEPAGSIPVAGGPESLVLDLKRGRAYTNLSGGRTAAIDLQTHAIVSTWTNSCSEATGIAVDLERGFLFAACEEGGVTVVDLASGKQLHHVALDGGIDIISYDPVLAHLFVPSAETAKLAVLSVSPTGTLSVLGTFAATADSHCIAAAGKVFFGDPEHGRLRVVADPYPAAGR